MKFILHVASSSSLVARWIGKGLRDLARDARRKWPLYAVLAGIWALAAVRVLIHPMPVLPILFNWTSSLPYSVAVVDRSSRPMVRGDYIVYAFAGEAADKDYPGLKHQPFFKRIAGLPGDVIAVDGRRVFVNDTYVGIAKPYTFDLRPLDPIQPGVIPPGFVYAQGAASDSFDSRYRSSGLVAQAQIVYRIKPLF